jgi:hypothetical protein
MGERMRAGITAEALAGFIDPADRARDHELAAASDPAALEGIALVWYRRRATNELKTGPLLIQPGVADDLPSLLSALAREVAWPNAPAEALPKATPSGHTVHPERAILAWARAWQVREYADLRVVLWWGADGAPHVTADLVRGGALRTPVEDDAELLRLLDTVAVMPRASTSPHAEILAANRLMQTGRYADAREVYTRALAHLPRHAEAHRNLALALARMGEWEAATDAMHTARALLPNDDGLATEGVALETDAGVRAAARGELACAAEHFLRILAERPDEPTALAHLGNVRAREGRLPEARAIFRRFLQHHPHHAIADTVRLALRELGE